MWLARGPISELQEEVADLNETLGYAQDRFFRAEKERDDLRQRLLSLKAMADKFEEETRKRREAARIVDEIVNGPSRFSCPECYDGARLGGKPEDCPKCHGAWHKTGPEYDPIV